jgi:dTDP-glucose 4,6-dehydratase
MTKTVLLTGAGGAIGVHTIAHIMHNTDWKIIATGSFRNKGYYDRITRVCRNHPDWNDRIEILIHDLIVPFTTRQVEKLRGVDYIVNLASLSDVQDSIDNPVPFVRNNVDIVLNMLELAREIKPESFIQFSTDEVYGPCDVDSNGHKEWDTILPSNPYAASKAAQEAIAISYWRSYGVPVVLTNTMNNFGEMQGKSKYTAMIQNKLEAGEKVTVHAASDGQIGTRYYIHSRNSADAVLHILNNLPATPHEAGQIDRPDRYNIVGDKQVSNLELAQIIAGLMGKELDYELVDFHSEQPGHDLHYGLDDAKLKETGWKSPSSFEESMKNTIDWQIRNPEWMK